MSIAISTTDTIAGARILRHVDLVSGASMRAKNDVADCCTCWSQCFGGEVGSYSKLISETKTKAVQAMVNEALAKNANAIVGVKFELINENKMSGVLVTGTAVVIAL